MQQRPGPARPGRPARAGPGQGQDTARFPWLPPRAVALPLPPEQQTVAEQQRHVAERQRPRAVAKLWLPVAELQLPVPERRRHVAEWRLRRPVAELWSAAAVDLLPAPGPVLAAAAQVKIIVETWEEG